MFYVNMDFMEFKEFKTIVPRRIQVVS